MAAALAAVMAISRSAANASAPAELPGFSPSWLDRTCNACEDFSRFATGGWLKAHPIPAKASWWGHTPELRDETSDRVRRLLEAAAATPHSAREAQAGTYYAACMNEDAIAAAGIAPLAPEFAHAAAVMDSSALPAEVAHLHDIGVSALFAFNSQGSLAGFDKPQIVDMSQAGLTLPDKSYYIDPSKAAILEAFGDHVAKMFALAGENATQSASDAQTVVGFETALAKISNTPAETRDPIANTHAMPFASAAADLPALDLASYATARKTPPSGTVNVERPEYFAAVSSLIGATPLASVTTYLRWRLLDVYAPTLAPALSDEAFHFNGTVLTGALVQQPRWERCAGTTMRALGETVGSLYDALYFPPAAKARATMMVNNVRAALRSDLTTLPWMTPATRAAAGVKLDGMIAKVGYPAVPRDYSSLRVGRTTYLANVMAANLFRTKRDLAKIGKPLDRQEWSGTSATVNAYYDGQANSISMYAGMMQSPYFDLAADDAFNYGAMGWVMGHEMTHGFDDQGRHYDEHGALRDWWTPQDASAFQSRATCVQNQFDAFEVAPGVHANGKLELGEAIADLGGVTIAFRAFEKSQVGKPRRIIDGFTPEQRFFLGVSVLDTESDREAYAKMRASSEPHPLGQFRINGTLANTAAFAAAFACPVASPMVRTGENRCNIW